MVISQFFEPLQVGFFFSYISPLVFVLSVTMVKEGYDDFNRFLQDKRTNNEEFTKITKEGKVKIKSADIVVGDIIKLKQNQRIPADMVVVGTSDESGTIYIRTDQLDGETDWKLRKVPGLLLSSKYEDKLFDIKGFIYHDPPSKMIYEFNGILNIFDSNKKTEKEPLNLENTLWQSTILASKNVMGIVIHTGIETRAKMNSAPPRFKVGMLDLELNLLNKILFGIMVLSALLITILRGFNSDIVNSLLVFCRFVVLLCSIIPISLAVNLDIAKTFNSTRINRDKIIPGTIARNSQIPEELGRIEYIFSDKTGTLTKNEMIFKQLAMEVGVFNEESFSEISEILKDECSKGDAPLLDLKSSKNLNNLLEDTKKIRRDRSKLIRDAITAMTLCNNVTPIYNDDGSVEYQASSPDEVALVKMAESLNMKLIHRTDKEIKIKNAGDQEEEYEVLANFPFSSDTKRMGILLKSKKHGHIIFYLKGAESVIMNYVKEDYQGFIKENAENLASSGLRTLVLTQKIVPTKFYEQWKTEYDEALVSMNMKEKKEKIAEVVSKLESNMEFLTVTGVEGINLVNHLDLLQDDVDGTIEALRNAGIKIWMLTGDKVETATCIAISTGIKSKKQNFTFIRDMASDIDGIYQELENFSHHYDRVLIIDGECLLAALDHHEKMFFEASMKVKIRI